MKKIFLLLFFVSSYAMGQWFYGSGTAQNLENKLTFKNRVSAQSGNLTPTSGVNAATGSVYQKTDGTFWLKQYGATTSWARVATSSELSLKEDVANKATDFSTVNDTLYPSVEAVNEQLALYATSSELSNYVSKTSSSIQSMNAIFGVGVIQATASAGLLLEANNGTDIALLGAGGGSNATYYGGVTVDGQLKADGNANQTHLVVEGHSTQTANLVEIYDNTPTYLAGFDSNGHLRMRDASASSAANPQLYFVTGSNKSGIGYNSAGVNSELFFTTNGTSRASVSVAGFSVLVPIIGNGNGASAPAIRPSASDGNTGVAWTGADEFCLSSGGTCRFTVSNSLTYSATAFQVSAGNILRFADSDSSNYVAVKAPSTVGTNFTWTLPSAVCSSGQSLRFSDGSGTMECYTISGGSSKVYSAKISTNGVVSDEIGGDFINGNCTDASPSVCTFNSGIATSAINCLASPVTTSSFFGTVDTNSGTSTVSVRIRDDAGAAEKRPFNILCHAD